MANSAAPQDPLASSADAPASTGHPRVFISYASPDVAVANALVDYLEQHGVPCWVAPRDVKPGALYADAIVRAISSARALVLVLSENSIASTHVGKEIERASSKKRTILALRIDTAPLTPAFEYFLSESQWVDATGASRDAAFSRLVEALEGLGAEPSGVIPPASTQAREPASNPRGGRKALLVAAGLAVVVVGAIALFSGKRGVTTTTSPGVQVPAVTPVNEKTIAVLPFSDMSERHDQEYFGDGMAEEILDLLTRIPGLRVIGRTSSFQFKGQNADLRTIGSRLGVAYILEGSVRRSGDRLRVTAQLIETLHGTEVWSGTYDRAVGDALQLQDQIAIALVRALQITVGAAELSAHRASTSVQAYDLYLRGRHAMDRFDRAGFDEAENYFQQVLNADPGFDDASAALSLVYLMRASVGFVPADQGFEEARLAAESALKRDPAQAIPRAVLGSIHVHYDWDWAAADRELKAAMRLTPHDPIVLGAAGDLQLALGHYESAIQRYKEAVSLDPLYADNYAQLSWAQIRAGQVTEAITSQRKALELRPGYAWGSTYLAAWLLVSGDPDGALAAAQHEEPAVRSSALALVYWALHRRSESDSALKETIASQSESNAYGIAWQYAYRGDRDAALKWLNRAYALKDPCIYAIKGEPLLATLVADPRYKAILRKMNLPDQ